MASTPKISRLSESKTGYVQNISPLKQSGRTGRKYFNATLQTMTSYENIVSFKPETFQTFVDMAKAKTPVCLQNIDTIPSLKNPGAFDVKFSSFSKIESPKETITFPYQEIDDGIFEGSIQEIKQNCSRFDKVTLSCKVQHISEPEYVSTRDLTKMTVTVSDSTDSIDLTVWNDQIKTIKKDQSYQFVNVSVRTFNEEKSLTTNVNSGIKEIPDINDAMTIQAPIETIETIQAVQVEKSKNCVHCKSPIQCNELIKTTKCQTCHKKMLTTALQPTLTVTVTINNLDYTVTDAMLAKALPSYVSLNNDELEDKLLLQTNAKVCNGNLVGLVLKQ